MSFKENKFCFFAISVFFVFIQWNTILALEKSAYAVTLLKLSEMPKIN